MILALLSACAPPSPPETPADADRCGGAAPYRLAGGPAFGSSSSDDPRETFIRTVTSASGIAPTSASADCQGGHGRKWKLRAPTDVFGVPCTGSVTLEDEGSLRASCTLARDACLAGWPLAGGSEEIGRAHV